MNFVTYYNVTGQRSVQMNLIPYHPVVARSALAETARARKVRFDAAPTQSSLSLEPHRNVYDVASDFLLTSGRRLVAISTANRSLFFLSNEGLKTIASAT